MSDKMLGVKEVMEISGRCQSTSYKMIKKVKKKYKIPCDDALVPEKVLRKYLGLDKV